MWAECVGFVCQHAGLESGLQCVLACFIYTWELLLFYANFEGKKFRQGFVLSVSGRRSVYLSAKINLASWGTI